jgi:ABC-2 type transport system permease protein
MKARRSAAIVLRQYYLLRGSLARVPTLFVWVAVDILLWGFLSRWLQGLTGSDLRFVPTLLGAVLLWDFFSRVMHGVTTAFFEDVWSRNFLNFFATPLSVGEYLAGLVATSVATSAVGLVVMIALATTVFGLPFFALGFSLLPFLLALFLFGTALGILGISVVLRLGPASEWIVWPIPAIVSPFAGVFYPLSALPAWMQAVGRVLPPSYVFEDLRAIVAGGSPSLGRLAAALGLSALYVLGACLVFARTHRRAVRTGLIARQSAETAG